MNSEGNVRIRKTITMLSVRLSNNALAEVSLGQPTSAVSTQQKHYTLTCSP